MRRRENARRTSRVALVVVAVIGGQGMRFAQQRADDVDASGPMTSQADLWPAEPSIWPWLSADEIRNWKPRHHQVDLYDSIATPSETAPRFVRSALLLALDMKIAVVARSRTQALVTVGRAGESGSVRLRLGRSGDRGPWLLTGVEDREVRTNPPPSSIVRFGTQVSGPAPVGATRLRIVVSGRGEGFGFETDVTNGRWTVAVPQLHVGFRQSQAPDGSWVTVPNSPAGPIGVTVATLAPRDFDFSFTTFRLTE